MRVGAEVPAGAEENVEGEAGLEGEVGVRDQEVRNEADDLEVRRRGNLSQRAGIREDQGAEESLLLLGHQKLKELSRKMLLTVLERRFKICLLMKVLTGLKA